MRSQTGVLVAAVLLGVCLGFAVAHDVTVADREFVTRVDPELVDPHLLFPSERYGLRGRDKVVRAASPVGPADLSAPDAEETDMDGSDDGQGTHCAENSDCTSCLKAEGPGSDKCMFLADPGTDGPQCVPYRPARPGDFTNEWALNKRRSPVTRYSVARFPDDAPEDEGADFLRTPEGVCKIFTLTWDQVESHGRPVVESREVRPGAVDCSRRVEWEMNLEERDDAWFRCAKRELVSSEDDGFTLDVLLIPRTTLFWHGTKNDKVISGENKKIFTDAKRVSWLGPRDTALKYAGYASDNKHFKGVSRVGFNSDLNFHYIRDAFVARPDHNPMRLLELNNVENLRWFIHETIRLIEEEKIEILAEERGGLFPVSSGDSSLGWGLAGPQPGDSDAGEQSPVLMGLGADSELPADEARKSQFDLVGEPSLYDLAELDGPGSLEDDGDNGALENKQPEGGDPNGPSVPFLFYKNSMSGSFSNSMSGSFSNSMSGSFSADKPEPKMVPLTKDQLLDSLAHVVTSFSGEQQSPGPFPEVYVFMNKDRVFPKDMSVEDKIRKLKAWPGEDFMDTKGIPSLNRVSTFSYDADLAKLLCAAIDATKDSVGELDGYANPYLSRWVKEFDWEDEEEAKKPRATSDFRAAGALHPEIMLCHPDATIKQVHAKSHHNELDFKVGSVNYDTTAAQRRRAEKELSASATNNEDGNGVKDLFGDPSADYESNRG